MTGKSSKPRIAVSKCLGFAACRYNGLMIPSPLVQALQGHVDFVPVCPEVEIGLGVPRDPIRIVEANGRRRLYQPATGRDLTKEMSAFAVEFFRNLGPVDGFLLKGRSPSCGIRDVKVHSGFGKEAALLTSRSHGLFAGLALKFYPGLAIEDEGRLENAAVRELFLTGVFARACHREISRSGPAGKPAEASPARRRWLMFGVPELLLTIPRDQLAAKTPVPAGRSVINSNDHKTKGRYVQDN